ncbi:MAG: ion transporter [Aminipila sp.]
MRQRIFEIVNRTFKEDCISKLYNILVMLAAVISLVPLMFKEQGQELILIDRATVSVLFLDYFLRWFTCDLQTNHRKRGTKNMDFLKYPFTPFAMVELLALLPSLGLVGNNFMLLRLLRVFKLFLYSECMRHICNVFRKELKTLYSVMIITVVYIFISALLLFQNEPQIFDDFFEALYWATTALTTIGYGDIYPMTTVGRLISMISSLFGLIIITLPAGIVTAGFVEEINRDGRTKETERTVKRGKAK